MTTSFLTQQDSFCILDQDEVVNGNRTLSLDEDAFVHINEWFEHFGVNPCSKTETFYLHSCRSEEPVQSNMDISTGHIVLVSILHNSSYFCVHFMCFWLCNVVIPII